jgi:deazaflavin-dependent oxidoreductase (nitroreductase family)
MTLRRAGRANSPTAALHHVGRKSGRLYVTRLAAEPVAGGFIIPLVYGDDTDWCRNLHAAGQGTLELRGEAIPILNPRVVELATVHGFLSNSGRFGGREGKQQLAEGRQQTPER